MLQKTLGRRVLFDHLSGARVPMAAQSANCQNRYSWPRVNAVSKVVVGGLS